MSSAPGTAPAPLTHDDSMRYFLTVFVGFLVGFTIYEAISYALGGSLDLESEAIKGVAFAAIAAALMTLFNRWRRSDEIRPEHRT